MPDIIELGVDVLNCQASVMDMNELKKFAGKIAFRTDIDRQQVLPFVSPGEAKNMSSGCFIISVLRTGNNCLRRNQRRCSPGKYKSHV